MEWTYTTYTIANYGISLGLVVVAIIGVYATFFSSKKGQEFVTERVIGVNPTKAHDDDDEHDARPHTDNGISLGTNGFQSEVTQNFLRLKQKSIFYIGIFCCFLGGMTLSITAVLMFQGCFLTSARLLPGDDCPEFAMDCFIFGHSALAPISSNVSFFCQPLEQAQFSGNISDATAWCYGWIIRLQTTKSVLDQLGVAIALIGFFTTMLAVIVYLGKCNKTVVLSVMFIISCTGVIIVLMVYKWSFAPLTYAILSLGIGLGIFGLVLFYILPKPIKTKGNAQMLTSYKNQISIITNSNMPYSKRPNPKTVAAYNAKTIYPSSKVIRK